jgi:hypothetical protein
MNVKAGWEGTDFGRLSELRNNGHKILAIATRSDGYVFYLTERQHYGVRVIAGCRNFTIGQYRRHVTHQLKHARYNYHARKARETRAILDVFANRKVY